MGPRPDGRGKLLRRGRMKNQAMRQWGRGQTAAESARVLLMSGRAYGVNGAAARRPRKVRNAVVWDKPTPRQWGRGQTAAESDRACDKAFERGASMGPRPDGRGKPNSVDDMGAVHAPRQWGRGQTAAESRCHDVPEP